MKFSPKSFPFHCFFLIIFITKNVTSTNHNHHVVNTLPGYSGALPFKLETGYISVGENEDIHLFYYFVESERDPDKDPLLLWLSGGPGCSSFTALVYEIGPFSYDLSSFDWTLPSLLQNPYSWTKVANIIFLDSPVGTGFSYANTSQGYVSSDSKASKDIYTFLRKWLFSHPRFIKNQLYIGGESYGGKIAPMVTFQIDQGNEDGLEPRMKIQGYIIGNPVTDSSKDDNEKISYAHRMGLISDRYFELAKSSCGEEYTNPDPDNYKCLYALQLVTECTKLINGAHILEPLCKFLSPKNDQIQISEDFLSHDFLLSMPKQEDHLWCRDQNYWSAYVWANDESVQETLRACLLWANLPRLSEIELQSHVWLKNK